MGLWLFNLLLFMRVVTVLLMLPYFSWRGIPVLATIGFAALLSYILFLVIAPAALPLPENALLLGLAVASEVLFGLVLGFLTLLTFNALRIAGQLIDMQSGMMNASLFDPQSGSQVTLFGQFYYQFAVVAYLVLNGHHQLFAALLRSLQLVPPGGAVFAATLVPGLLALIYQMFIVAFQLAAPVALVLVLTDFALGLISKTVPQLHVFMVGMPLKVGVALFVLYLSLPYMSQMLTTIFTQLHSDFIHLPGLL